MIDIIIAAYNCEKTINKCIDSLLKQTYKDINIIVVNDGSTDNTYKVLEKICKRNNNVIVFNKENGGAASARNYGLENSKSSFFTFIDADDYVTPDYVLDMVNKQKEEDYDLVISNYVKTNNTSSNTSDFENTFSLSEDFVDNIYLLISKYNADGICSKLYKKNKLYDLEMKKQQIGEDLLFNICFMEKCNKIAYIPKSNYIYVINNSSLMNKPCFNLLNDLSNNYNSISNEQLKTIYCFRIFSEYIKNMNLNKKKYELIPDELYVYMRKNIYKIKSIIGIKKYYYYKLILIFYKKEKYYLVNFINKIKKKIKEK